MNVKGKGGEMVFSAFFVENACRFGKRLYLCKQNERKKYNSGG